MNKRQKLRERIFKKYNGRCAYCGELLQKGWHIDELKPIIRDLKWGKKGQLTTCNTCKYPERLNEKNQMPSCPSCNINKHQMDLEDFRKAIYQYVESLKKRSVQYKMANKYELITETKNEVIFYFEKHKANFI